MKTSENEDGFMVHAFIAGLGFGILIGMTVHACLVTRYG